ncbi:ABC transporter ATP-binding protein [Paracoccus laeviglucosivorans]|uniref:Iron(III) transport system ATP-binding protein/putative spermidine/putrescine transport system ATP-binding protein n=1 Tax=Paracoccus laeviglucosivorans TaxID=1197861 RepID=A0A521FQB6_9RHOB|nr:ABC transporter ATP-binding protein [Paracoccus laeviglucosivorans]SMO97730.1 iron(III) transport system ATP-binding protein/putative spermidine/putrescine transport system ATP-binding protein [Paracoccus laeviglucosivorans]
MATVEAIKLHKRYGDFVALDDVTLNAESGQLVTLLGPSGCGKSTTLRCLAGFLDPEGGDIKLDGDSILKLPSNRRGFGVVFQNYALFPHMTVAENIGYGLRLRKCPKPELVRRVGEAVDLVRLNGLEDRLPRQISGGQQQRVALARALVMKPRLLLLDEPLANLDARLRDEVRWLIRDLQQQSGITAFYVTHDQSEAMAMSDMVAVMKSGRVAQFATPREIYQKPVERYVADFTGEANFLSCQSVNAQGAGQYAIQAGGAALTVAGVPGLTGRAELLVRPETLRLAAAGEVADFNGRIVKSAFVGASLLCEIALPDGGVLKLTAPPNTPVHVGDAAAVVMDRAQAWLMPEVAP